MPKVTPFLQEVVFLVADLLTSLDHAKQANKLKQQFELPEWVKKDNPLIKKGLTKILKDYINFNQKVLKYYQNRKPESEDEVSEEEEQAPKPALKARKSVSPKQSPLVNPKSSKINGAVHQEPRKWMISQFAQPKRLEDLNDDQIEIPKEAEVMIPKKVKKSKKQVKQTSSEEESSQQTPKQKKQKKEIKKQKKQKKAKGPVDTSYLNSEEEFDLEDKKAKKSVAPQKPAKKQQPIIKTRKQSAQIEKVESQKPQTNQFKDHPQVQNNYQQNDYNNGPKKFFSRINAEEVGHIPENRRDNTFEAKAKYGAGDSWGQYGYDKLKVTRGESFKKTKGKLKNRAFQGSGININEINSIPIM